MCIRDRPGTSPGRTPERHRGGARAGGTRDAHFSRGTSPGPAAAGSCLAGSALADLHVVVIAPAASRCATTAIWYRPLRSTLTAPLARRMPASGALLTAGCGAADAGGAGAIIPVRGSIAILWAGGVRDVPEETSSGSDA